MSNASRVSTPLTESTKHNALAWQNEALETPRRVDFSIHLKDEGLCEEDQDEFEQNLKWSAHHVRVTPGGFTPRNIQEVRRKLHLPHLPEDSPLHASLIPKPQPLYTKPGKSNTVSPLRRVPLPTNLPVTPSPVKVSKFMVSSMEEELKTPTGHESKAFEGEDGWRPHKEKKFTDPPGTTKIEVSGLRASSTKPKPFSFMSARKSADKLSRIKIEDSLESPSSAKIQGATISKIDNLDVKASRSSSYLNNDVNPDYEETHTPSQNVRMGAEEDGRRKIEEWGRAKRAIN